jgi:hypothetical protein
MTKQRKATVRPASGGRWRRPPGLPGAWYSPHDETVLREHVLGAPDERVAYREARLMVELYAKLDATFVREDVLEGGEFPFRDDLAQP